MPKNKPQGFRRRDQPAQMSHAPKKEFREGRQAVERRESDEGAIRYASDSPPRPRA